MTTREGRIFFENVLPRKMREQLRRNGRRGEDHVPVARLVAPYNKWSWLLVSQDPEDPDKVLCLADLDIGQPEIGYVSLSQLADDDIRGIVIELDDTATLDKPLSWYASRARKSGKIEL